MKQPTDEEHASMARAALMAACAKKLGEKTAEAKAELAAFIARFEAAASGFEHEAISTALLEAALDRFHKDKGDVTLLRFAFEQALLKAEESPPMRIVDTDKGR
jgi:hypothetical protein